MSIVSSTNTVREILEGYLQSGLLTQLPGVPVSFGNTRHLTPQVPWIYAAVIPNYQRRANIGSVEEFEICGIVNVTCMVPEDTGTKRLREMADAVDTVMMDRQIPIPAGGHITTYGSTYRDRGSVNAWYAGNVFINWRARVRLVR